jgi:hypothetical protein
VTALKAVAQLGEICKLEIAAGAGVGGDLLAIDAQGITHLIEQAGDSVWGDGDAEMEKFLGDGGSCAAGPT